MRAMIQEYICSKAKSLLLKFITSTMISLLVLIIVIEVLMPDECIGGSIYQQQLARNLTNNITNPYLDGVVAPFPWSQIEPQENEFRWEVIEDAIQPWVMARKKVILGIHTGTVATIGDKIAQATPDWVFAAGAAKMLVPDGTILPIYWDLVYLEKYENFVKAFAKRYDGDPRIEFIRIGVGVWGEVVIERWFTRPESTDLHERWTKRGYDPERWIQTTERVMAIYNQAFQKTPCAIMLAGIHGAPKGIFRIADRAVELGFYLEQNGLKADWRQYVSKSPISKIFQQYKGRTKLILEAWGNTQRREVFKTGEVAIQGPLMETIQVGIEYGADYLLLYASDIAKTDKRNTRMYDPSSENALKYAFSILKKNRAK